MTACARAVAWTVGMQCANGGWGAFDADNDSRLVAALPFCDFGEVTDPPSADVTAHVIEMLADEPGVPPEVLQRGLDWLCGEQEADGSWFGRWGVNYVYGTGAAVPALVRAGVPPDDARIRRAVAWLEEPPESRRRVGRGHAVLHRRALARPRRLDRVADGLGAAGPPGGRRGARARSPGGAWPGWSTPSGPTAAGTSPGSPAPASRGISTSTTTSTGWSFRSWPSGRYRRSLEASRP